MSTALSEVFIHIDENIDAGTLDGLEQALRHDAGVVSVGHRADRHHMMAVIYDSEAARASSLLHTFQERGLHAQLIDM